MKNTIEDPLTLTVVDGEVINTVWMNDGMFELVDLSVAQELEDRLIKCEEAKRDALNERDHANAAANKYKQRCEEQSALMAEMAEALTRISDMANPEIITDSGFYYAAQKALTKYNQYINKQQK